MFSKLKGYRRLKEQEDEEKKYQEYKDNWVKKGGGTAEDGSDTAPFHAISQLFTARVNDLKNGFSSLFRKTFFKCS